VKRKSQIEDAIGHRAWSEKAVNRKSQIVNRKSNNKSSSFGFTSIELIIVILVLSILAGTAIVSFRLSDQDKSNIAADQLVADIQYVQMRAMGIGTSQSIQFRYDASNYSAYRILDNAGNPVEEKRLPDNVIIRNANFNGSNILTFNTLGEPTFSSSANGTVDLGKGSSPNTTITVLAITGKVQ
jgi:type II secretory pathway pseudopilin PulG